MESGLAVVVACVQIDLWCIGEDEFDDRVLCTLNSQMDGCGLVSMSNTFKGLGTGEGSARRAGNSKGWSTFVGWQQNRE